jgi:hypothetical protein
MEAVRTRDPEFLGGEFTLTTGRPGNEVRGRQEDLNITGERYEIDAFEFEELEGIEHGAVVRSRYSQRGRMAEAATRPS